MEYNIEDNITELINNKINPGSAPHGGYAELSKASKHDKG